MARGIMRVMMSGAVAGCQADRARSVALGVVTGGGQSIPAALAAYLNVTLLLDHPGLHPNPTRVPFARILDR